MKRRDFIKLAAASSTLPLLSSPLSHAAPAQNGRSFRLTYQVSLPADGNLASLWLPLPLTSPDGWQVAEIGRASCRERVLASV